ncbi:hypothetical protein L3Q82_018755, partial [Scortum barcoo]
MRFSSRSWNTGPALYPPCRVLEGLWEFAQPVHMCFVDLEKAFDRVPRGILWGVLHEYGVRGPLLRAVRSLYDRSRSLVRIAGRFLGVARGRRESGLGTTGFHLCFLQMMLSCWHGFIKPGPSACVLERFGLQPSVKQLGWESAPPNPEAMVLDRKRVACPLRVSGEVLPQVEEFKYLGVLFTSEGKMEREIDRRIGAASCSYAVSVPDRRGEEGAESKGKALDLPVNLYVPTSPMVMNFGQCPTGRRPRGRPRTRWRDYVSRLAWERLGIPPEELEEVSGVREVWASLLRLLPPHDPVPDQADDEDGWMDGW